MEINFKFQLGQRVKHPKRFGTTTFIIHNRHFHDYGPTASIGQVAYKAITYNCETKWDGEIFDQTFNESELEAVEDDK